MEDQGPNEIGSKCEVVLLDNASGIHYPVCSLMIHENVMGDPSIGGLSQILVLLEMALLNQLPP